MHIKYIWIHILIISINKKQKDVKIKLKFSRMGSIAAWSGLPDLSTNLHWL